METQRFFSLQKEFGDDKQTSCRGVQWGEGLKAVHFQSLSDHLWSDKHAHTHTPTDDDRKEKENLSLFLKKRERSQGKKV